MKLNALPLTNEIIFWWDQAPEAGAGPEYSLRQGEKTVYTGSLTHCRLEGLRPGEAVSCSLWLDGRKLEEGDFRTRPEARVLDVRDFGAVGDGVTMNREAIQRAFDACGEDGEVWFPAGVYRTGGLRLHSRMRVRLDPGAELRGTDCPEDYLPKIPSRFEGTEMECYQSLLNLGWMDHTAGPNCSEILIYGGGTLCGGGQPLAQRIIERERALLKEQIAALGDRIQEYENLDTLPGRARGRLINLSNCENIHMTGLTLANSPSWNVHMIYSRGVTTDHCRFESEGVWNGDGWDPDSSENCTLFACHFHTGDDSVAIKSGKNPEGNRINRPTRGIRIFDCGSDFGLGIAIGSEMSGGVEDVRIWNCDMRCSLYGVQIKATRKRGGAVRNITVRDSVFSRFRCCAVGYNDDGEGSPVPPVFENVLLERVRLSGWAMEYWEKENHPSPAIDLSGFDTEGFEARNMVFRDCDIGENGTVALSRCRDITLERITALGKYEHPATFWIGNEKQVTQH